MRQGVLWTISLAVLAVVSLVALKAADLAVGAMVEIKNPIAPPGIKAVTFRTSEFDIAMHPNGFGFRGAETAIRPAQIAVLGDSFTVGWGLGDEDTWPVRLQKLLRQKGRDVDVYNLGKPGTDTLEQVEIARTYVPLLKPSIVILAVVQGDDVAGIMERSTVAAATQTGLVARLKGAAEAAFPNLLMKTFRLLRGTQDATAKWPQLSAEMIAAHHLKLDPEMSREALAGNINPFLLAFAGDFPDRNDKAYGDAPEAVAARKSMREAIRELSRLVRQNGGRLILVSVPAAPFVTSTATLNHRRMGFRIDEASLSGEAPDRFLADVCRDVGSACVLMLDDMRAFAKTEQPFFPLDGHLNKAGAAFVAERLARELAPVR